ncbi:hypothetical protein ACQKM2_26595 [Streptomyces sp. NPDC004126]|uniref:hypothetical protein n=1 Tax=Streptomyces sp. NPDC004126 TaxID=3390695 RepID=UPI003CFF1240
MRRGKRISVLGLAMVTVGVIGGCTGAKPDHSVQPQGTALAPTTTSTTLLGDETALTVGGVLTHSGLEAALPKADELPPGWNLRKDDYDLPWKGDLDAYRGRQLGLCFHERGIQLPPHGASYHVNTSAGDGDDQGAHIDLGVLTTGEIAMDRSLTLAHRVALAQENLRASRAEIDCLNPVDSRIGDGSISFNYENYSYVTMYVSGVEVKIEAPRSGPAPTAEAWARVLEQRIRSVSDGKTPTARIAGR